VWNPYFEEDISILKRIQRRATKIPRSSRKLSYEDRLKVWDITTLKKRRTRGDIIQIYKLRNNIEVINWYTGPSLANRSQTRSASANNFRLSREYFPAKKRNDFCHFVTVRDNFFLNRVVEGWNRLSSEQILLLSLNSFKARIDKKDKAAIAE
jgi:hypothetical protein